MRGIVLSSIPYKERDRIVTLFSEEGLLKFYAKIGRKQDLHKVALTTPPTVGDFVLKPQKGLSSFIDGTVKEQFIQIRERYESLETALHLCQLIERSQWQGKAAPALLHLLIAFLRQLGTTGDPSSLKLPFLIKLMKHEGILNMTYRCSTCYMPASYRFGGDHFCEEHRPTGSLLFSSEEEKLLSQTYHASQFSHFPPVAPALEKRVEALFEHHFFH